MTTKQAVYHDDDTVFSGPMSPPSVQVRIDNMREIGPGVFELIGVRPRDYDWSQVRTGLGFGNADMPDSLMDDIDRLVRAHDVREFLLANMK